MCFQYIVLVASYVLSFTICEIPFDLQILKFSNLHLFATYQLLDAEKSLKEDPYLKRLS